MEPWETDALAAIARAFAARRRPDHFTDFRHCCECAEHDETLRARTPDTIAATDLPPAWDAICFATLDAYLYYLPGLARLALGRGDAYTLDQFLFHMRAERVLAFSGSERRAVRRLLEAIADHRLDAVHPSDVDLLGRRIAELHELEALARVPAPVRALFFAVKLGLDDPYASPGVPIAEPPPALEGWPGVPREVLDALAREHEIERWLVSGADYALEVTSRTDPSVRHRATRDGIHARDGDGWTRLAGYLHLDGTPVGGAPLDPPPASSG
jgi:hypothetical protein